MTDSQPISEWDMTTLRSFTREWRLFQGEHSGWLAALATDEPIYCLPSQLIGVNALCIASLQTVVSPDALATERAFSSLCESFRAVGVFRDRPVSFPLLSGSSSAPSQQMMEACGWTRAEQMQAVEACRQADEMDQRLLGAVGWLITDQQFLHERDELKATWRELAGNEQPDVPLGRPNPVADQSVQSQASSQLSEFSGHLVEFLDCWGLQQLATWDLPMPQGPMLPALLNADSPAMPRHGLHLVLPVHYPLTGNDQLLERIRYQQERLAQELGFDPSLAGLRQFRVYGQMFKVAHWEQVATNRYARPNRPRGFVTQLCNGLELALEIEGHHLKKLRTAIAACRRGERARVRWLN